MLGEDHAESLQRRKRARLFGKDVDPGASLALFGIHSGNDTPVATPFKLVETRPMYGEVSRLEELNVY
jgi:hypothetical protein